MNLCNDNHDAVCFEGRECPVCSVRDELRKKVEELERLEGVVTDLKEQLEQYE